MEFHDLKESAVAVVRRRNCYCKSEPLWKGFQELDQKETNSTINKPSIVDAEMLSGMYVQWIN